MFHPFLFSLCKIWKIYIKPTIKSSSLLVCVWFTNPVVYLESKATSFQFCWSLSILFLLCSEKLSQNFWSCKFFNFINFSNTKTCTLAMIFGLLYSGRKSPDQQSCNSLYIDRVPSFYYQLNTFFKSLNANMSTFHPSETACTHFRNSHFQSDKID